MEYNNVQSSKTFKPTSNSYSSLSRILDITVIFLSLQLAAIIYNVTLTNEYLIAVLMISVVFLNVAELFDLYRSWRVGRFSQMALTAWACIIVSFLMMVLLAFLFKQSEVFSRVTIGIWFVFSFSFVFIWRGLNRLYRKSRRKLGYGVQKVAIIGATEAGFNLFLQVQQHHDLGYDFQGFYEDRKVDRLFKQITVKVAGKIDQAIDMARKGEVQTLFIALPLKAEKRIADILIRLGDTTVDVHFVPDFLLSNLIHARIAHVGDIDTLSVFESPYHGAKQWIKRTEDIIIASLILLLIIPFMLLIAIIIKLTSRGPVLFKQYRYGLAGQKISVWKFRSMMVTENDEQVIQATKNDSRITPFGGFLRRTSLDELPQFFNVLAGGMSIVGPRPHAVVHNEEYRKKVEFYMLRHKVKPGITGWAQINGWRGETDTLEKMEKRVACDLQYIKHWTLWFDIKIIFLTICKGFIGKNAY